MKKEDIPCIYRAYDIHHERHICILNRLWSCVTDATVLGELCPYYEPEGRQ